LAHHHLEPKLECVNLYMPPPPSPHVDGMVLSRLHDKCTLFFICLRLGTRSSFCLFYACLPSSQARYIFCLKKTNEVLVREKERKVITWTIAESGCDITYWGNFVTSPR
jgi:hypothetical protein